MHASTWFCILVLLSWGILGVIQKSAMNYVSAEAALVWTAAGFMLLQPLVFPTTSVTSYSTASLTWALLNGVANGLGFLSLLAAMRYGGKASVVEPLSALYPAFVLLLAPTLLHEQIRTVQGIGIGCAMLAGLLLSTDRIRSDGRDRPKPAAADQGGCSGSAT
ncbi:MAG: DMT family transporter [Acidobacteria bacterium]|nr:DMT family transporter [Acidobacteriota bacterium]